LPSKGVPLLLAGAPRRRLLVRPIRPKRASQHAACSDVRHLRAAFGFRKTGRAIRAADPGFGCHGFSPWQLRPRSLGAAREAGLFSLPFRECARSSRRLADPLRLSAEGATPDGVTSDALLSPDSATARAPNLPRSLLPQMAFAHPGLRSPSSPRLPLAPPV
jgi:hypothetical protein